MFVKFSRNNGNNVSKGFNEQLTRVNSTKYI